jgi:hypothetical protein
LADQALDETKLTGEASSPFLPDTNIQFAWDSTCLGLIKTCPRLYQYTIIDGWQPKGESIHLRFGIEYHQALQEYDVSRANGVKHEDAIHDTIAALMERTFDWNPGSDIKAGRYKNRGTLISLVVDYLDYFADDPAETYIKSDGQPAVELSFRFELDWGPTWTRREFVPELGGEAEIISSPQPYILSGHLDRVVNFNDQLMVMDRKTTTTTLGSYYFNQWEPSNQMTLYTLAGRIILDSPIRGVIIDAAQVMLDQPNRYVRGFTYRTEDQLQEWLDDLKYHLIAAENYAQTDYWPMNDTACDKFGGCRFRGICSKSPQVREIFLKSDFVKLEPEDRWNPLKPR